MKYRQLIALAVCALLACGCAQKKNIATAPSATATEAKQATRTESVLDKTIAAQPDCENIAASRTKFTIHYQERTIQTGGSITLVKDSILIISIQPLLGIELFRLEATPNDVMVLDKMNKRYVQLSYSELQQETGFGVRYEDIQAIALDRLFVVGKTQSELLKMKAAIADKNGVATIAISEGKLDYTFSVDKSTMQLTSTRLTPTGKVDCATINYNNHRQIQSTGNGLNYSSHAMYFPETVEVTLKTQSQSGSVTIELPDITVNGKVNANRARLTQYNKTSIKAILSGK